MRSSISWRAFVLVAAPAALAVAVGCSSFSSDDSPSPAPEEAGTETSVLPVEAGEASPPAVRFCKRGDASTALFCADFDEGPVEMGWQLPFTSGGSLATTPSDRSPPNALLATVDTFPPLPDLDAGGDAGDAGGGSDGTPFGVALLSTTLGRGAANGASLEFDLRLDEIPAAEDGGPSGGQLASLGFDLQRQAVSLSFFQGGYFFVVHDPGIKDGTTSFPIGVPTTPGWFHVRMVTAFDGSGAGLYLNGIPVAAADKGIDSRGVGLVLNIGPSGSATKGKARVAYDNVTVTLL